MRVVRIYHSGVVGSWRARDRELRSRGAALTLVAPPRWNEGGSVVLSDLSDDFVVIAPTIGSHPFTFLYSPAPLARAMRRVAPDVVDCHEEPASLAALEVLLLRSLFARRAPILFYGAENLEKRYPIPFRWIERWALRSAAAVYVCNREAGVIFRRKGFRGHVEHLGLGVDQSEFSPGPEPAARPFRVGYVGRLDWRKGVQVVVSALRSLPEHVELHVYGTGADANRLKSFVHAEGVAHRVCFHGHVDHSELPAVYRSLHVFAMPSQTTPVWVEQFGRVAIEAMASGVPVIGSDSGSIPDVVGDAGVIVPEKDVAAWAGAIERLAGDPEERARLRAAGVVRAQEFTWSSIAARHYALYERVLA